MNGGLPNSAQQPGGMLSNGRFAMNSLPASFSQLSHASSHGQSGLTNKGGPQIANSFGNLVGGGIIGGSFSSNGGLTVAGLASRFSLTGSLQNQSYGVGPQTQEFRIQTEDFPALQRLKGGDNDYRPDFHQDEQLRENTMQSQHLSMARSAGFGLGVSYSSQQQQQQQQQQEAPSINGRGASLAPNSQDFLHLHGSNLLPTSNANHPSQFSQYRSGGTPNMDLRPVNSSNALPSMGYDQLIQQHQQLQLQSQFHLRHLSTFGQYRDQTLKSTNAQVAADRRGLLDMLSVSKNPGLTYLARGIDLTTLGLNLISSEDLCKKFASPWSEEPASEGAEYSVPECYHAKQPPALNQTHFSKFQLGTLFYIFYSMPKEEAQLYAANELINRGWLYHKKLWQWLIRAINMEPLVKTNSYERGSYFCFDPKTWKTIRKENFVVQYEMIEKRPMIPEP